MYANLFAALFVFAFVFRYLRLVISVITFALYKSVVPRDEEKSAIGPQRVTVVVPSLEGDSPQIRETVSTILDNNPHEVILVTIRKNATRARELAKHFGEDRVRVLDHEQANKRLQMLEGLDQVKTDFTVFSDDDVFWKPRTLAWLIAPFDEPTAGGKPTVGATGTCQRLRRPEQGSLSQLLFNFYAAAYLERRNFDCASCNAIDGGLPCLSGRTAMYRTDILKEPDFQDCFRNEKWRGSRLNHADDDNFLTRWLSYRGWEIRYQYSDECEVETTLADDHKFILQCLRWSRSNWRSNLTSLFDEKHVWSLHPWSTYSVFQTTITAWALPWDCLLIYLLVRATKTRATETRLLAFMLYLAFWLLARCIKLTGHWKRYPRDLILLPCSILFGYFHCVFIKTWALYTLDQTTWGSRTDADVDDACRMACPPPYPIPACSSKMRCELRKKQTSPLHRSFSSGTAIALDQA